MFSKDHFCFNMIPDTKIFSYRIFSFLRCFCSSCFMSHLVRQSQCLNALFSFASVKLSSRRRSFIFRQPLWAGHFL